MSDVSVLTVGPLDLGANNILNYMRLVCRRFAITGGRRQVPVKYPAKLDPSGNGSIRIGADNLDATIWSTPGRKIVLGYSQGAQVAGAWMRKYAHGTDAPPASELSFILIGNPERKFGKQPWTEKVTPDYTQYSVMDVARTGDNWADYDPKVHGTKRIPAMFGKIHNSYWDVDVFDGRSEVVAVVGNTAYVRVP